MNNLAGIGRKGRSRLSKVLESTPKVVTSSIVADVLHVPLREANRLLARWCKSGWLYRVKRGVYIPVPIDTSDSDLVLEEPFTIVDSIYRPGYVGGFSAIKYWDLSEQIIETVFYFTTKQVKNRNPIYGSREFKIKTIRANRLFGTKNIWYGSMKVSVSDPSKSIVDILDDPKIVGGMSVINDIFGEYVESEYCDFPTLLKYVEMIGNKTIYKRLGLIADIYFDEIPAELLKLEDRISSGYSVFDPTVSSRFTLEKWNLKISNSWKQQYDRKK